MGDSTFPEAPPQTRSVVEEFKPWWERMWLWCFGVLAVSSVTILSILTLYASVDCEAKGKTALGTPSTKFVNSICFEQVDQDIRFSGWNILYICIVLGPICCWWEVVPQVLARFSTFKDVNKSLGELHLRKDLIKELALQTKMAETINVDREVKMQVIKMHHRLFLHKNVWCSLFHIYALRSIFAIAGHIVAAWWRVWPYFEKFNQERGRPFTCSLHNETASAIGVNEFLCSNSLPSQLDAFFWLIFIVLHIMALALLIGLALSLIAWWHIKVSPDLSRTGRNLNEDYAFVLFLVQHSTGLCDSTKMMLSLLNHRFTLSVFLENFNSVIWEKDTDRIRLFCVLHKDGVQKIADQIDSFMKNRLKKISAMKNCPYLQSFRSMLRDFLDLFESLLSEKRYKTFLQLLDLLFADFTKCSDPDIIDPGYERCCFNVSSMRKHLKQNEFYKGLRSRCAEECGQRVVKHILLQLVAKEERGDFLNLQFNQFINGLREKRYIDDVFAHGLKPICHDNDEQQKMKSCVKAWSINTGQNSNGDRSGDSDCSKTFDSVNEMKSQRTEKEYQSTKNTANQPRPSYHEQTEMKPNQMEAESRLARSLIDITDQPLTPHDESPPSKMDNLEKSRVKKEVSMSMCPQQQQKFSWHDGKLHVGGDTFIVYKVDADGSCFFHAVQHQLTTRGLSNDFTWIEIRKLACDEVEQNWDYYSQYVPDAERQDYIDEARRHTTFADHPLFEATARILNLIISTNHLDGDKTYRYDHGYISDGTPVLHLALQNEHFWSLMPTESALSNFQTTTGEENHRSLRIGFRSFCDNTNTGKTGPNTRADTKSPKVENEKANLTSTSDLTPLPQANLTLTERHNGEKTADEKDYSEQSSDERVALLPGTVGVQPERNKIQMKPQGSVGNQILQSQKEHFLQFSKMKRRQQLEKANPDSDYVAIQMPETEDEKNRCEYKETSV